MEFGQQATTRLWCILPDIPPCHLLGCGQLHLDMHSVSLVSHAVSRERENSMPAVVPVVQAWLARYNRPKH